MRLGCLTGGGDRYVGGDALGGLCFFYAGLMGQFLVLSVQGGIFFCLKTLVAGTSDCNVSNGGFFLAYLCCYVACLLLYHERNLYFCNIHIFFFSSIRISVLFSELL